MKKVLIGIIIYLVFLVLYFLQSDFFSWFTIAKVSPNLFVMLILFIGLFASGIFALIMGLLIGLTLDLLIGKTIGICAIMLCLVGILAGYIDKNFSKDSKLTIILMVIVATCFYEIGYYIFNIVLFNIPIEIKPFAKTLLIEVLYNIILTIIFYKPIIKAGYKIESYFKQKNILTRYF